MYRYQFVLYVHLLNLYLLYLYIVYIYVYFTNMMNLLDNINNFVFLNYISYFMNNLYTLLIMHMDVILDNLDMILMYFV